jgi:hypothetical protein
LPTTSRIGASDSVGFGAFICFRIMRDTIPTREYRQYFSQSNTTFIAFCVAKRVVSGNPRVSHFHQPVGVSARAVDTNVF